ncbi:MAG: Fic family protein [Oscillospiraceae bacterium]
MAYSLKKLFHIDRTQYEMEYEKRFNSDTTVHFDFKIGKEPAFVCQTPEIFNLIISIERTDKTVNQLHNRLPQTAINQFTKRCLVDEIVLSNNIEGVHSTRKEINAILEDLSEKNRRQRFYGLVKKYRMLLTADRIPLETCRDIRKIYDDIFLDEIRENDPKNEPDGEIFRKSSVSVYSPTEREIHRGLTPEDKIIATMDSALELLKNDNLDILVRIALFHYLFGYIHPFYDGNGRTSRFISSYLLSQELNHLIGYRISYTIKENLSKYYKAFEVCNHPLNRGELTPFVEMFLNIIDISHKQLLSALEKRVNDLERYKALLDKMLAGGNKRVYNLYYVLIQAALFSEIGITAKKLASCINVSENTLRTMLKVIPQGLLVTDKREREFHYLMNLEELDRLYPTSPI